jgi:hypothetical protein
MNLIKLKEVTNAKTILSQTKKSSNQAKPTNLTTQKQKILNFSKETGKVKNLHWNNELCLWIFVFLYTINAPKTPVVGKRFWNEANEAIKRKNLRYLGLSQSREREKWELPLLCSEGRA